MSDMPDTGNDSELKMEERTPPPATERCTVLPEELQLYKDDLDLSRLKVPSLA